VLTGRELGANSINTSIEISVELFAPAETSDALGRAVVADVVDGIANGTFITTLLSFAAALNITFFDTANVEDAYLIRESKETTMLAFLNPDIIFALVTSVTVGSISATVASSAIPAGDPLSLVFAVQFVSLTSSIDGLPGEYVDDYAGKLGWCVKAPLGVRTYRNHGNPLIAVPLCRWLPSASGQTFKMSHRASSGPKNARRRNGSKISYTGTFTGYCALCSPVCSFDMSAPGSSD
jgi:hypothetical protein